MSEENVEHPNEHTDIREQGTPRAGEREADAQGQAAPDGEPGGSREARPPASPTPPKGPRVWRLLVLGAVALLLLWVGHVWGGALLGPLTKAWKAVRPEETGKERMAEAEDGFYTCGMHPWVILPEPGDCPICHMKLTRLDPDKFSGEITIDPVVTQNIGVRVAPVVTGPLARTIRTVGKVDYDETAVRDINIRVDGWMEKLYVDYVGAPVESGQPLFDLFSRELYSAQEEYLIAYKSAMDDSERVDFLPQTGSDLKDNLDAARRRLLLFGIEPEQIERLEQEGKVSSTMKIISPYSGIVIEKHAFEGMHVTPGMATYRIADLSKVWVFAALYEYQLPFVKEGQDAVMTLPYIPGQEFEGRVTYIYPWLDEKTREVRVRMEFSNPHQLLKPGMFATVELRVRLADERTLAPREAVIDTGERQVAFVSLGAGKFEPRDVQMGVEGEDGMVEILSGLRPGEMVVTSGQFLLDSEARIREALGKMIRGDMASEQERAATLAGPAGLDAVPKEVASDLALLLERYFAVGSLLSADEIEGTAEPAREIGTLVDRLLTREIPGHPHFWNEHDEVARVRGKALEIASSNDLDAARLRFGDLSVALSMLIRATGVPRELGQEVRELHCPMFAAGQGGSVWLQPKGQVRNPYFGAVMLECFDRETTMPLSSEAGGAPQGMQGDMEGEASGGMGDMHGMHDGMDTHDGMQDRMAGSGSGGQR